ncbi:hypothetical protein ACJ41O_011746 [Fusarium nematophilum]
MPRWQRLVPSAVFVTVVFYFLFSRSRYEYPPVALPQSWKDGYGGVRQGTESPATTPGVLTGGSSSFADDQKGDSSDGSEKVIGEQEDAGDDEVDWSRFAYVQYVTNEDYLCNSVMIFETLYRLGSKADRVMMYPGWMLRPDAQESKSHPGRLLIRARDEYNVKLQPIQIQHRDGSDLTWADSFTKLLAFNQTQYDRVLSLDSDGMVLQPMDELFQLPASPVAMPRAYWLFNEDPPRKILSSQVMVVQPSEVEFQRVLDKMDSIDPNDYDMEVVNDLYLDSALVLPHRPYDMLTAEFRKTDHAAYLGSDREEWDPRAVLREAKFVHFSDWPVPKPWIEDAEARRENRPECGEGEESCAEREIWNKFYTDFSDIRKVRLKEFVRL